MTNERLYYLAIDLGASSGRHIVGYEQNEEIILDEVYRFENGMENIDGNFVWDTQKLFTHIKEGIKTAFNKYGKIESLSIDTWGVDYVLLNGEQPIYPVYAYRNERTVFSHKKVHEIIPFNELYSKTGIQFQTFNTVYQLYDDKLKGRLDNATDFLMIPEYFEYLLTGKKVKEYTAASTSALLNLKTNYYDFDIIDKLGLPKKIFSPLSMPGTVIGNFKSGIAQELGGNTKVIACASHDTASAFEAIDCPPDSAILSSGTWSLLGVKSKKADSSSLSLSSNFTNEGGNGYYRYLKNIMGMWIVNNIKKEKNLDFKQIISEAKASSYECIFDANDESLNAPLSMTESILKLLKASGYDLPKTNGDLFNSVFHSLAYSYGKAINDIEKNLNKKINSIYIIGGGAKNAYLNSLTEKYSGKKVVAMPIEATALGNIKIQTRYKNGRIQTC